MSESWSERVFWAPLSGCGGGQCGHGGTKLQGCLSFMGHNNTSTGH